MFLLDPEPPLQVEPTGGLPPAEDAARLEGAGAENRGAFSAGGAYRRIVLSRLFASPRSLIYFMLLPESCHAPL